MKLLNSAHVNPTISVENLDHIVANITSSRMISFSEDEIPAGGSLSSKALYITVRFKGFELADVLIDNRASVNVMPLKTLKKLPIDYMEYLKPSSTSIRAYDGRKSDVLGDIELPLTIGPVLFVVKFQVLEITPSYSCLLGRPWIHGARAVPSSLHQRVKFIADNKLITVLAAEEMIAQTNSLAYIEAPGTELISFQSMEIEEVVMMNAETQKVALPRAVVNAVRHIFKHGYKVGSGLGCELQGRTEPITLKKKKGREGLGYQGGNGKRVRLNDGFEVISFISGGWVAGNAIYEITQSMQGLDINVIDSEERQPKDLETSEEETGNWTALDLPIFGRQG